MSDGFLETISPGSLATVQDFGRLGNQRHGVSVSGAMDIEALTLGNRLVGNPPDTAAVEITLGGAKFEFHKDTFFSIAGADMVATLDGLRIPSWTSVLATVGSVIEFGWAESGVRTYLCVAGGITTSKVLGSRSVHVSSGLGGGVLAEGSHLPIGECLVDKIPPEGTTIPPGIIAPYSNQVAVRIIPGSQASLFSPQGIRTFYSSEYMITAESDRQGLRLEGPIVESLGGYDITSDGVALGSIQITGNGQPIILMADRQPTGGYAKIGTVASVDIPALAQSTPGSLVRFMLADVGEMQRVSRRRMHALIHTELVVPEYKETVLKIDNSSYSVSFASTSRQSSVFFFSANVEGSPYRVHVEKLDFERNY